ncbi:hypothetical protein V8G54_023392 [Vigna mungo]|uniref:Uncharacterized protein n=1 Tax=Vigna mungo TaxID=3915 RepID=A0AAQ3N5A3_VIGMU
MAALAAAFSASFFFLSNACFAFAISSSLFFSFSISGLIGGSLTEVSFGISNSYSSASSKTLLSTLDFKSCFGSSSSGFSSGFLIRPSLLNCRISSDGKSLFS